MTSRRSSRRGSAQPANAAAPETSTRAMTLRPRLPHVSRLVTQPLPLRADTEQAPSSTEHREANLQQPRLTLRLPPLSTLTSDNGQEHAASSDQLPSTSSATAAEPASEGNGADSPRALEIRSSPLTDMPDDLPSLPPMRGKHVTLQLTEFQNPEAVLPATEHVEGPSAEPVGAIVPPAPEVMKESCIFAGLMLRERGIVYLPVAQKMEIAISKIPLPPDDDSLADYRTGYRKIATYPINHILAGSEFSSIVAPPAGPSRERDELFEKQELPNDTICYVIYFLDIGPGAANTAAVEAPATQEAPPTIEQYLSSRWNDMYEVQASVQAGGYGAAYKGLQYTRAVKDITEKLGMEWSTTGLPSPNAVEINGLIISWESVARWMVGHPEMSTFRNWRMQLVRLEAALAELDDMQDTYSSVPEVLTQPAILIDTLLRNTPRKDARVPKEYQTLASHTWKDWEDEAKTVLDYRSSK
ncbi:hypothetical protein R3P38DRAFT_2900643 [Favolaschia claudopus]|uniref:Uncharacterized protein n=1 Tax=Favolaschia claudopus TaxID=2862362 RepID=A0AAW0CM96_9AGAR